MVRLNGMLLVFLVVVSAVGVKSAGDIDTEECNIWSLVIDQLKSERSFNITGCKHNDQCTGFTCNGSVELYNHVFPASFGATFQPCLAPKQLYVITKFGEQEFTQTFTISSETQHREIPLLATNLLLPKVVLNITVQLLMESNQIGLALNSSVQIRNDPPVNSTLIPYLTIRIPDCVKPAIEVFVSNESETGKKCELSVMHQCGNNQSCSNASVPAMCVCIHGLVWNKVSQQCEMRSPSTDPKENKQSSNSVVVIVACTLVSIVAVVVVLILVIRFRRYRQRYGQHELLINNEGSDQDLDGDSPMLNG